MDNAAADDSTALQTANAQQPQPCLDTPKNSKLYEILHHIESYGTCMKH
jgi:hypothetical protein